MMVVFVENSLGKACDADAMDQFNAKARVARL